VQTLQRRYEYVKTRLDRGDGNHHDEAEASALQAALEELGQRNLPPKKREPNQTLGEVIGEVTFSGLSARSANCLMSAINSATGEVRWGTPVFSAGPNNRCRVTVWAYYGPRLGAWPSDLRRAAKKIAASIGTTADIKVDAQRNKIASRREYEESQNKPQLLARSLKRRGIWSLP
jgi:hypothetical protein